MWINVEERLPEKDGLYRVLRAGFKNRAVYEDECKFISVEGDPADTYWTNMRNTVISSVIAWWEKE